ncbi:SixA phosphatase family protein [Neolewinella persica]|uniref:SixA phosphatase family protein n=1 Tax=Neolewinella persica TaxID=70998 RepID=UPI00037B8343|nr:histidine phosphatase family protein [Neolewinella persica]
MKTIYFVRHAKSSWDDISLDDHDRPLNARGKRDAPVMADRLAELQVIADGLISSTAKRAKDTSEAFRLALNISAANCQYDRSLYHAWPASIEKRVRDVSDDWSTVLFFGHNPGYTDLANRLQHNAYIGNVPTCGIIMVEADIDNWEDFSFAEARRAGYFYPKQQV